MPSKHDQTKTNRSVQEVRAGNPELILVDRNLSKIEDIPQLWSFIHLRKLSLACNRLRYVPSEIANLINLEQLNLCNNEITDLPISISSMPRLKALKLGFNRLWTVPPTFGQFPALEVLDLTYNNLSEKTAGPIFQIETLRALFLGDNDFEVVPSQIRNCKNLQVLVLRDNDLVSIPRELEHLRQLRELHLQGNQLTALPAEFGNCTELTGERGLLKLENNPWIPPIQEQLVVGVQNVMDLVRSGTYQSTYSRHLQTAPAVPPRLVDKSRKASRKQHQNQQPTQTAVVI